MDKIIYQVDAFSEVHFGGNPAGVVPDATGLTEEQMQKIAMEMNLSETAFVFPMDSEEADFWVRFFTPTQEVDLCGHATIGAFYVLTTKGYIEGKSPSKIVKQKTRAGILPVEIYFNGDVIDHVLMTQSSPQFISDHFNIGDLSTIMGIDPESVGIDGFEVGPQVFSTGLPDIILPVRNLDVLRSIKPDYKKLSNYSKTMGVVGVHAFTMEKEEDNSTLACRNFAPAVGINEESATGTSNGALGAYLVKNNILEFKNDSMIICEQGYYMGRPSKIMVKFEGAKDDLTIKVGGKAVITLEGVLNLE